MDQAEARLASVVRCVPSCPAVSTCSQVLLQALYSAPLYSLRLCQGTHMLRGQTCVTAQPGRIITRSDHRSLRLFTPIHRRPAALSIPSETPASHFGALVTQTWPKHHARISRCFALSGPTRSTRNLLSQRPVTKPGSPH